jgi:hypothetical protein
MEVSIKDKDKVILGALRAVGFDVNSKTVEKIINIIDYTREQRNKGDGPTMMEIIQVSEMVESLYKE